MPFLLRSAVCAALLLATPAAPARAASTATKIFLDNLVPNVDFLDRSARLALEHAKGRRLKGFAEAIAREQTAAIDALFDWTQGQPAQPGRAPVVRIAASPANGVASHRSVAVAEAKPAGPANARLDPTPTGSIRVAWPPPATTPPEVDPRLPRGQEDLDALGGLDGAEFDAAFREKQADALTQVVADYETYLAKGDDPALLALARVQLPKAQARLKVLGKV